MTSKYFAFIDLETGGLNKVKKSPEHPLIPEGRYGFNHYAILEFALIITDESLNEICRSIHFVIKHDQETLDTKVGAWSKNEFKDTLMKDCLTAQFTLAEVEQIVCEKLKELNLNKDNCHLAGNSIYYDNDFIQEQMPTLATYFSRHLVDVSSHKFTFQAVFGQKAKLAKEYPHKALDDIENTIKELKFYFDILKQSTYFIEKKLTLLG